MIVSILVMCIEVLFLAFPLYKIKEIVHLKEKIKLFCLIFVSNIISTLLFNGSIFKFILYILLMFFSLKLTKRNTKYCDIFIVIITLGFKILLDYLVYLIFFKLLEYFYFLIILEIITLLIIYPISKIIYKIYKNILKMWNSRQEFYFRYILLILFNSLIMLIIYTLLKIKEVF